jgi:ribosome biogenesis GTPase
MSTPSLVDLGLRPFFQQQLSLEEVANCFLGRIIEQHKSDVIILAGDDALRYKLPPNFEAICVGDWVVNDDFNLNRIERYLALVKETHAEPVVILTKADLCDDVEDIRQQVQQLDSLLSVHCVNGLAHNNLSALKSYCQRGKTVAFLGSSGVGKSTLVNNLLNHNEMETNAIREQDSKGRHTTTYRTIKWLPEGGLLMDTPGMRELQLSDVKEGIKLTFADIESLATECRFKNCQHQNEPECAVISAVESGALSARRLDNFQKLLREDAHNSATLAQKRAKDRTFTKMVTAIQDQARSIKKFK